MVVVINKIKTENSRTFYHEIHPNDASKSLKQAENDIDFEYVNL